MSPTTRIPLEDLTCHAGGAEVGDDRAQAERLDDSLHFGRAWFRYRNSYRRADSLRILIAGCSTGRSGVSALRLNPGAQVLVIDASSESVAAAAKLSRGIETPGSIDFRVHDPAEPLPDEWGRFDFVVCRGVLATAADSSLVLNNLARALDASGLLLLTVPSHSGQQTARAFRRAVDTLVPEGAGPDARVEIGLGLFDALRPDHPIRAHAAQSRRGNDDTARVIAGYLSGGRDWTLNGAADTLADAGLRFLYAATPWRWRVDRVFDTDALPESLRRRTEGLPPEHLSRLVDALDPSVLGDEYQLHACPAGYDPPAPSWPDTRLDEPLTFDRLVPHLTGLVDASRFQRVGSNGRVTYTTVAGVPGELDRLSLLLLTGVDGVKSCGEIAGELASQTRARDDTAARQDRWIELADGGLILLEPDPIR